MIEIRETLPASVKNALGCKFITKDIYEKLSDIDKKILKKELQDLYDSGTSLQRSLIVAKAELIHSEGYRKRIWRDNHLKITESIIDYLTVKDKVPSCQVISKMTGLSVKTVNNHLDMYATNTAFIDKLAKYKASALKMADILMQKALTGKIPAIKLYMQLFAPEELANRLKTQTNVFSNTNNVINVEGNIFKKEDFEGLSDENINEIKSIISNKTIEIDEHF